MIRLVEIEAARGDQAFVDAWRRLERNSLEANPFFAPQMVLPAARHLEDGGRVRLLVHTDRASGRLAFLVPVVDALPWDLAHRSNRLSAFGVGLTGLRTWLHRYAFLGTPLMDADTDPVPVWRAVLDGLPRASGRPWLELPGLATHGSVATGLATALGDDPAAIQRPLGSRGYVRRRPESTYIQDWVSSKNRSNLNRRRRILLGELGTVNAVDRASGPGLDESLDGFLALEQAGWKGRGGSAVVEIPHHTRFFRETLRAFGDDKRLVLMSLESPEHTVAQSISLIAGAGQFGFKKAYDERWARTSPGQLLDVEVLETFHRTGELSYIDTCSDPARSPTDFFGDRLEMHTTVVPLGPLGRRIVPRLFPQVSKLAGQWRNTATGDRVRRLLRRTQSADSERRPVTNVSDSPT